MISRPKTHKKSKHMQILFRVLNHHSQQNLKDLILGSGDCFSNISKLKTEFAFVLIFLLKMILLQKYLKLYF